MKTLSIGITTFRNRLNEVKKQINDIRSFDTDINILLAVNTNYNEKMPEDYRKDLLAFCCQHKNIYPLMFPGFTGLAKMWNNLIVHSTTTHIFLMNDDISFSNPMAIMELRNQIQTREIFEVNWGFGTFVISKKMAHELGYFDERFIAFGDEDGDFMKRYSDKYGKLIEKFPLPGLMNRIQNRLDHSYDTNIECYIGDGGHKPLINKKIFEAKNKDKWENMAQYPYEMFIQENRTNIEKFEALKL